MRKETSNLIYDCSPISQGRIIFTPCISTQSIQHKTSKLKSNQNNARGENNISRKPNKHSRPQYLLSLGHLGGRNTDTVGVTVEHDTLALTSGTLGGLNPLADTGRGPHSLEETSPAGVSLRAVVLSHDALDGLAGLIGVVEGDVADVVVQHVGLDDTVEDVAADEAKVTVNGGSSATGEVPHFRLVVRKGGVSVLEEGNGDCKGYC